MDFKMMADTHDNPHTDPHTEDLDKHRRYIERWIGWRTWPHCPLRRSSTATTPTPHADRNTAYLVADRDTVQELMRGRIQIHYGPIWTASDNDATETYESWAAFFAAGWRVD
jgi:hypothetical protein